MGLVSLTMVPECESNRGTTNQKKNSGAPQLNPRKGLTASDEYAYANDGDVPLRVELQ